MEIRKMAILALLGTTGLTACDKGSDSAGAEGDADTDSDTDSDTDTDTDTDTDVHDPWHADTISIQTGFGWDATKNELVTVNGGKGPLGNVVQIELYNYAESQDLAPYQFCFFVYDLGTGARKSDPLFKDYWLSFDLTGITPLVTGKATTSEGDCDMLDSFVSLDRGDGETLEDFAARIDLGLGIGNWGLVDSKTYDVWQGFWGKGYDTTYGAWNDAEPYFSYTAFSTGGFNDFQTDTAPGPLGVSFAYLVDKDWNVVFDDAGAGIPLDQSAATSAQSAYYSTVTMYAWGTGFGG